MTRKLSYFCSNIELKFFSTHSPLLYEGMMRTKGLCSVTAQRETICFLEQHLNQWDNAAFLVPRNSPKRKIPVQIKIFRILKSYSLINFICSKNFRFAHQKKI